MFLLVSMSSHINNIYSRDLVAGDTCIRLRLEFWLTVSFYMYRDTLNGMKLIVKHNWYLNRIDVNGK